MRLHPASAGLLALLCACGGGSSARQITDPIPDVPSTQQRAVSRHDFGWYWPLAAGAGTLGCSSGAVVFRAAGVTYALNDAAKARRYADVTSIHNAASSAPTNPLKRLRQDDRMRIFADAAACPEPRSMQAERGDACAQRLLTTYRISDPELRQIQAEGQERRWPPLTPSRVDLKPLVDAGLELCSGK